MRIHREKLTWFVCVERFSKFMFHHVNLLSEAGFILFRQHVYSMLPNAIQSKATMQHKKKQNKGSRKILAGIIYFSRDLIIFLMGSPDIILVNLAKYCLMTT